MKWIETPPGASAAFHMGLDAFLSEKVLDEPVLRVYRFPDPTVTFGFRQEMSQCLLPGAVERYSLNLSRRRSGGKAILHHRGLTYSLVIPRKLMNGDVLNSYRKICDPLYRALKSWNPSLEFDCLQGTAYKDNPVCFLESSVESFSIGGKKVVGSAQRRTRNNILQHGEIQLFSPNISGSEIFRTSNPSECLKLDELKQGFLLKEESAEVLRGVAGDIRKEFEKTFGNSKTYALKCRNYNCLGPLMAQLRILPEREPGAVLLGKNQWFPQFEIGGAHHAKRSR